MINKIKLIVSDLDGTIVGKSGFITNYTHQVLSNLENKGIKFCVATGRHYMDSVILFERVEYRPFYITLNGSLIQNSQGAIIKDFPMESNAIDQIIEFSLKHSLIAGFYTKGSILSISQSKNPFKNWIKEEYKRINKSLDDFEEYNYSISSSNELNEFIYKCEIFVGKDIDFYVSELSKIKSIDVSTSGKHCIEITRSNVNKGRALSYLLEQIDLKKNELIVCGDSDNDMSMIEAFPYSIAPSNARASVKEKVNVICESCQEDGIAKYLETNFISHI